MTQNTLTVPVGAQDHIQGDPGAPVVLVEYGDYECPPCGEAYSLIKSAQQQMGNQLCFVFRNFPLQMHPHAEAAAEAAENADAQGKFWPMHDLLFQNQSHLEEADIMADAGQLGLDKAQFSSDFKSHKSQARIQSDMEGGMESGVNGTPGFFINGQRFDGDWQGDGLLQALQNAR